MQHEIAVRLRRKLRKFPELATHVETVADVAAEIVPSYASNCLSPTSNVHLLPLNLREFSSNFFSTNLLNDTMGALVVFVQVLGGAVASFLVGMFWFSPVTFGRIWWRYQFPAKRFGEMEKCR